MYPPRHDVLIGFVADWESGEPMTYENERVGEWGWYDLDNLPSPIFYPAQVMLEAYKTGKNYYDKE